jgi:GntR family transcriptional regulator/MocR family aminotransferase
LRIHPVQEFIRMLPAVAAKDLSIGGYEDYRGYRGLREALAELDRADGVATNPETEMVITSGAQQAITLIARCFGVGAKVAIEDPCFPGARIAFRNSGAEIVPLASTNDGLDPAALKTIAVSGAVSVLYCCPTYGNPRGWSWSEAARIRVLEAARTGGFMIIEDDFLGDLDYLAEKPRRLAGHAKEFPDVKVVRIRTFSKCLLPTLRLAGVSGDSSFINKLLSQKVADDIGSSALLQRGLAQFIREGRYAAHLERVRPRYRATREALRGALAALSTAGDGLHFDDPPAGLSLLGYLPADLDPARFIAECERDGVIVMSGRDYWLDGANGRHCFRIGFGSLTSEEVVQAVGFFHDALVRAREFSVDHSLI